MPFRGKIAALAVGVLVLLAGASSTASAGAERPAPKGLPSFQEGTVPVEGGKLHYVRGGSGPPLVLLHGWPETWRSWAKVMPDLARTHTVIALDLPGLGGSSVPGGGYDAAHTAQRVHQAVTTLGYDEVSLLAHDLGALVAYPYARDFAAGVTRMAVLESPLNGFGLEEAYGLSWHFNFNSTPKPVPEKLIGDAGHVRTYLGWMFSSARYPDRIDQKEYIRAYSDAAHRSAGFDYYRAFTANAADNKANAGKKLAMPVLAMGAADVFGPGVAQSFGQVATDVRQVVAPDSGHWIPEENAPFLASCAKLFFGSPPADPPSGDLAGCAP